MTNSPTQAYAVSPPVKRRRRWIKPVLFTVGAIVILLIGVGIGAAGSSQASLVASQKAQITRLQAKVSSQQADVTSEQNKLTVAQQTAQNAVSAANTAAAAKYASREQAVQQMQRKLAHELGTVAKSTISADGVYVVGRDIPSGTYHTSGGSQCYYATLDSTDTSNIMDNNNFNGPETVDVSGAYAFQITGGCTWHKIG
jgi:carboxypeptidase C (cathepsin A)